MTQIQDEIMKTVTGGRGYKHHTPLPTGFLAQQVIADATRGPSARLDKIIEQNIAGEQGFESARHSVHTANVPYNLRNTEIGVQLALADMEMERHSPNLTPSDAGHYDTTTKYGIIGLMPKLYRVLAKLDEVGMPYSSIKDAATFDAWVADAHTPTRAETARRQAKPNLYEILTSSLFGNQGYIVDMPYNRASEPFSRERVQNSADSLRSSLADLFYGLEGQGNQISFKDIP